MKPDTLRSALTTIALYTLAALASACSSSDGYQPGALGNGGFYFSCDDAVACTKYSNDAAKFPKSVSLGSTFAVRFVPKDNGSGIHFNEGAPDRGITIQPVADFVTRGPSGLTAVKPGYATLASRDASGQLVDYVVLRVAKPDALVVYDGDDTRSTPTVIDRVSLSRGATKSLRAFAQEKKQDLAGSLQVEWTSTDTTVVDVQGTAGGKVTIVARKAGNATLTATGGTFTQSVPVVVGP